MYADYIRDADSLLVAGSVLQDYLQLLVVSPAKVPLQTCQTLMDLCIRHLRLLSEAGVHYTPKHHLWCHLTLRIRTAGNPRCYSTFLDESLNRVLANIAAKAHRSTWELRTFHRVQLLPLVSGNLDFVALS